MHDPMTVAHEIKYPWFEYKPWPKKARRDPNPFYLRQRWKEMPDNIKADRSESWPEGYRNSFITVWHVDPELDGSDDSCGYCFPKLTKAQIEKLRNVAWSEARNKHFLRCASKEWTGDISDCESLYRGLAALVGRVLRLKLSHDNIAMYAIEAVHHTDLGKFGGAFCFLPGYHTNSAKDSESDRQDYFHHILCGVAKNLLREKRPWWQHPKWHVWHWKFQCHPLQTFKRWAFSRCCKCGGRFKWGASVTTHQWNSGGPSWTGENHVMHDSCCGGCAVSTKEETE